MANNTERRKLIEMALREYRDFKACMADIKPGGTFWNTDSRYDWGPGAWQLYSKLSAYRDIAQIMGFRLDIAELDRFMADPKAKINMIYQSK